MWTSYRWSSQRCTWQRSFSWVSLLQSCPIRSLFFSTPLDAITHCRNWKLPQHALLENRTDIPKVSIIISAILRMSDQVSFVLLLASYSKHSDNLRTNIITDLNNIEQTLCWLLVDMIVPTQTSPPPPPWEGGGGGEVCVGTIWSLHSFMAFCLLVFLFSLSLIVSLVGRENSNKRESQHPIVIVLLLMYPIFSISLSSICGV